MTAPHGSGPHFRPYTADEVLSWAEDGVRHEVIHGTLYVEGWISIQRYDDGGYRVAVESDYDGSTKIAANPCSSATAVSVLRGLAAAASAAADTIAVADD